MKNRGSGTRGSEAHTHIHTTCHPVGLDGQVGPREMGPRRTERLLIPVGEAWYGRVRCFGNSGDENVPEEGKKKRETERTG